MLPTLIQIYDKNHLMFYPVQKRETNGNFTGCQIPHFMIVLKLYDHLLNRFGQRMSIFEEYGIFKEVQFHVDNLKLERD